MTTLTIDEAMALQLSAADRLERAEAERRIATLRLETLVLTAPLRLKAGAVERARRADAELAAAQAAYESAQDLECPET